MVMALDMVKNNIFVQTQVQAGLKIAMTHIQIVHIIIMIVIMIVGVQQV